MNDRAPSGVEIHADSVKILGTVCYDMLPFEINKPKIRASLETRLDHRTISMRPAKSRAVFRSAAGNRRGVQELFQGSWVHADPYAENNQQRNRGRIRDVHRGLLR